MESLCKVRRSQREAQGRPVSQHGPRHQVAPGKNPRALLLMKPLMVFPLMIKLLIRKQINRSVVFAEKKPSSFLSGASQETLPLAMPVQDEATGASDLPEVLRCKEVMGSWDIYMF